MIPNFRFTKTWFLALLLLALPVQAEVGHKVGQTAPGFSLKTMTGDTVTLKGLTQKGPVMLVFYETQCVYCYTHINDFNALHDKYSGKGLSILAINYIGEMIPDVKSYAKDNGLKYTVIIDKLTSIDVAEAYHVVGSPTIVLIAPDGKVVSYGYTIPDVAKWIKS